MSEQNGKWNRTEGVMITSGDSVDEIAEYFTEGGIIACLEHYPQTPGLLSVTVAVNRDNMVAMTTRVKATAEDAIPGPVLSDIAASLANKFKAHVSLGNEKADGMGADAPQPEAPADDARLVRAAYITPMNPSMIPLLAASEGVTVRSVPYRDNLQIVTMDYDKSTTTPWTWFLGDLPVVELSQTGGEYRLRVIENEDSETWATHTWGMQMHTVYGKCGLDRSRASADFAQWVDDIVGRGGEVDALARVISGLDEALSREALRTGGLEGFRMVCRALHLPEGVGEYLEGTRMNADLQGATSHEPRGWVNAMGRSVDMLMEDRDSATAPMWTIYERIAVDKPWILKTVSLVEAAVGGAMFWRSFTTEGGFIKRTILGVLGITLAVDSLAELALARYIKGHKEETALLAER